MRIRIRTEVDQRFVNGNQLDFFLPTGVTTPPIVTLADNDGFPFVQDIYARSRDFGHVKGIHITVRFESASRGPGRLALNVYQPATEDAPIQAMAVP